MGSIHPPLEAVLGPKLAGKAEIRVLFAKYPTPDSIRTAGRSRVEKLLGKHDQARTAASLTGAIFDALDQQTLVLAGTTAYRRLFPKPLDKLIGNPYPEVLDPQVGRDQQIDAVSLH